MFQVVGTPMARLWNKREYDRFEEGIGGTGNQVHKGRC